MGLEDNLPKLTRDMRANILLAFEDLGGVQRLVEWANDSEHPENLGDFYTKILPKVIPRDIRAEHTGKGGGPIVFTWEGASMKVLEPPSERDSLECDGGAEEAILLDAVESEADEDDN